MRRISTYILIILSLFISLNAQNEGNIWLFGKYAGIDFTNGYPVAITGQLNSIEGCATISSLGGKLIFYTDGEKIWNSLHGLMPNGNELNGHQSSTQSSLIIPDPGNPQLFYVFSLQGLENDSIKLSYSIVDLTLDNGLGDVRQNSKNTQLFSNGTEKMTSTRHSDGNDYWLIIHEWDSNSFLAWRISKFGIDPNPVRSSIGTIHSGSKNNKQGYMKVSTSGKKLALAVYDMNLFEVFDFDNSTGIVSNPKSLQSDDFGRAYGIEFSPDAKKLYASKLMVPSRIYQFNLDAGNSQEIMDSKYLLTPDTVNYFYGALQIGPDNRIYTACKVTDFLGVINDPDQIGADCDYRDTSIYLGGNKSTLGLPSFVQSWFLSVSVQSNGPLCKGDTLSIVCNSFDNAKYSWTGPSGFTSNMRNPVIESVTEKNEGIYQVVVTDSAGRKFYGAVEVNIIEINCRFNPDSIVEIGSICIGKQGSIDFDFINTGETPIKVKSARILKGNSSYNIDTDFIEDASIPRNEAITLQLDFKPVEPIPFLDSLIIEIDEPCPARFSVGLKGTGTETVTTFSIADTAADIGEYLCIPVIASLSCDNEDKFSIEYEAEITLRGDIFLVDRVEEAELISIEVKDNFQHIRIRGSIVDLDEQTKEIALLCGNALLGAYDTCSITFTDFKLLDELIEYKTIDGSIQIGYICANNITKVKSFLPQNIELLNQPVSSTARFQIDAPTAGFYTLEIFNISGENILEEEFKIPSDSFRFTVSIDISNHSKGLYFVVLKGISGISTVKVLKL